MFTYLLKEIYAQYVELDTMPTKEDFDCYDLDHNGVLFLEEWIEGTSMKAAGN